jgi:hypothetical protein
MNREGDCTECAAFIAEMKAAITEQFGERPPRTPEQVQRAVERYLSMPDEAVARLNDAVATTKAGQVYARFIGASHKHRLR